MAQSRKYVYVIIQIALRSGRHPETFFYKIREIILGNAFILKENTFLSVNSEMLSMRQNLKNNNSENNNDKAQFSLSGIFEVADQKYYIGNYPKWYISTSSSGVYLRIKDISIQTCYSGVLEFTDYEYHIYNDFRYTW